MPTTESCVQFVSLDAVSMVRLRQGYSGRLSPRPSKSVTPGNPGASEALQFFDERGALQAEEARRRALVLIGPRQSALDHVLLDLCD